MMVNKKIGFIALSILLFWVLAVNAQNRLKLKAGESLKYTIYYGLINGGEATLETRSAYIEGKKMYHCKAVAYTTGITDKLFKVRDIYESYYNPVTSLPYKCIRDINEGKYHKYDEVLYFHSENKVLSQSAGIVDSLPGDIRDMVSTFYFLRNYNYNSLKFGDTIKVNTFFDEELFPFNMRYRGWETVKTKLGEYKCIKLVPIVEPGRAFKTEDDMTVWLAPELKNAPVRIRFNLVVGAIKIDLIDHSGIF
jgi:hypothetical protein